MTARTEVPAEFRSRPNLATEPQKKFINDLLDSRDLRASAKINEPTDEGYAKAIETIKETIPNLTKKQASEWIESLKKFPKLHAAREGSSYDVAANRNCPLPEVPAGHYAVEHDGTLKFFRVDKPTEGKWAGWTFLKVQASEEYHPIKNFDYKREVLTSIATDPAAASARYGHELGKCGVCNTTLTNEESRARGIGPVCARKNGWM
jgi:hypothetical protein